MYRASKELGITGVLSARGTEGHRCVGWASVSDTSCALDSSKVEVPVPEKFGRDVHQRIQGNSCNEEEYLCQYLRKKKISPRMILVSASCQTKTNPTLKMSCHVSPTKILSGTFLRDQQSAVC